MSAQMIAPAIARYASRLAFFCFASANWALMSLSGIVASLRLIMRLMLPTRTSGRAAAWAWFSISYAARATGAVVLCAEPTSSRSVSAWISGAAREYESQECDTDSSHSSSREVKDSCKFSEIKG